MTKHSDTTWLSVHIFYNEPWEEFLTRAVEPYVNTAVQTGIVQQYFFIRYWERGPHIRLRLKGETEMVKTILEPNIKEHFETYFESKPSRRIDPTYPLHFPEESKWLPNNSISIIKYQPELDRYGGPNGTEIAENQFMLSSQTILEIITSNGKQWSYDDAMGNAIKLHLALVESFDFSIEEAILFFEMMFENWLPHTLKMYQGNQDSKEIEHQIQLSKLAFENAYDKQKDALIPFHEQMWNGLVNKSSFDNDSLNKWTLGNREIFQQFNYVKNNNELHKRSESHTYKFLNNCPKEKELIWQILADYIHMTNNRLGIHNKDESYISFIMMNCLKEVLKKKESKV